MCCSSFEAAHSSGVESASSSDSESSSRSESESESAAEEPPQPTVTSSAKTEVVFCSSLYMKTYLKYNILTSNPDYHRNNVSLSTPLILLHATSVYGTPHIINL